MNLCKKNPKFIVKLRLFQVKPRILKSVIIILNRIISVVTHCFVQSFTQNIQQQLVFLDVFFLLGVIVSARG